MRIKYSKKFLNEIEQITDFIAKDSPIRAENFYNQLLNSLDTLDFMPYKYRKSTSFEDENVRDCVYKKYVIPYKIDLNKEIITILGIYKENEW